MPEDEVGRTKIEQADALLRRMNHLLRWYRAISRQAQITELSRAQASPFSFVNEATGGDWSEPLVFESPAVPIPVNVGEMQIALSNGLATGAEPAVSTLSMLDAEYAIKTGRFREAVLFSWGRYRFDI